MDTFEKLWRTATRSSASATVLEELVEDVDVHADDVVLSMEVDSWLDPLTVTVVVVPRR